MTSPTVVAADDPGRRVQALTSVVVMRSPSADPKWVQRLDELHLLTPMRVFVVVLVAIVATLVVRRLVNRGLRRVFERALPVDRPRAEARHRALTTALRSALVGVIWTVAVITVISEVGVNIGGFVATATVVGGAIAFGAQTLIRDVISGFFVLADDQFGVGDEVDLGHATGTVERVTLRTARLRDAEGRIWHVPHGNVQRVGNLTKAAVALLDVEVARTMDVGAVFTTIDGLIDQLVDDDSLASAMLHAPVVVGIVGMRDDRVVVRVSVDAQPRRKEEIARAWRRATLDAFARGDLVAPPLPSFGAPS